LFCLTEREDSEKKRKEVFLGSYSFSNKHLILTSCTPCNFIEESPSDRGVHRDPRRALRERQLPKRGSTFFSTSVFRTVAASSTPKTVVCITLQFQALPRPSFASSCMVGHEPKKASQCLSVYLADFGVVCPSAHIIHESYVCT
jgi:hypothetical protein